MNDITHPSGEISTTYSVGAVAIGGLLSLLSPRIGLAVGVVSVAAGVWKKNDALLAIGGGLAVGGAAQLAAAAYQRSTAAAGTQPAAPQPVQVGAIVGGVLNAPDMRRTGVGGSIGEEGDYLAHVTIQATPGSTVPAWFHPIIRVTETGETLTIPEYERRYADRIALAISRAPQRQ